MSDWQLGKKDYGSINTVKHIRHAIEKSKVNIKNINKTDAQIDELWKKGIDYLKDYFYNESDTNNMATKEPKHPGNAAGVGPTCPDIMCVGGTYDGYYCIPPGGDPRPGGITEAECVAGFDSSEVCAANGYDECWDETHPPVCIDMRPGGAYAGGCSWGHKAELGASQAKGGVLGIAEPGWNHYDRSCCPGCTDDLGDNPTGCGEDNQAAAKI